jgi:hypothetical protein
MEELMRETAATPGAARRPQSGAAAPLAALALLVAAPPAASFSPESLVVLVWFDPLDALPDGFEEVGQEVSSIFLEIGVDVRWTRGVPGTAYGPEGPRRVPVILLPEDPVKDRRAAPTMGVVLRGQEPLRVVWVFVNNVRSALGHDVVRRPRPDQAEARPLALALARVVAHEVVHAIAPDEPHSRSGLMRKALDRRFLLGPRPMIEGRFVSAFLARLAAHRPPGEAAALRTVSGGGR